jgi:hypothetical protein
LATGTAPYGFRIVGPKGQRRLAADPEGRAVGRKIVEWKQKGYTWEAIYWHLARNRVYQTKGKGKGEEYSLATIYRTCQAEMRLQMQEKGENNGPIVEPPDQLPPATPA